MNPLQPPSDLPLTTPLIHEDTHIRISRNGDDEFDQKLIHTTAKNDENYWGGAFVEETRKQLSLAGPLIAVGLLTFSLHIISLMFVGHLGELALSGASMATSFAYVTGFSVLVSWVSRFDLSVSCFMSENLHNDRNLIVNYGLYWRLGNCSMKCHNHFTTNGGAIMDNWILLLSKVLWSSSPMFLEGHIVNCYHSD